MKKSQKRWGREASDDDYSDGNANDADVTKFSLNYNGDYLET